MTRAEITSARELPRSVATPVIAEGSHYVKHCDARGVWDYSGHYETITPADLAVWSCGDWRECDTAEATYFVVGYASWSDYSGGTVERSNYRALLRDFPGVFVDVHGGYGTRALLLPAEMPADFRADDDEETRADFWSDLLRTLAGLEDYPLYDESDLSELETELAAEDWDLWLSSDVARAVRSALSSVLSEVISEDEDEYDITEDVDEIADRIVDSAEDEESNDETLRDMFYRITYSQDYGPECESAVSVHYPFFDQTCTAIVAELRARHYSTTVEIAPGPRDFATGWRALCACGWVGYPRYDSRHARSDADWHSTMAPDARADQMPGQMSLPAESVARVISENGAES